MKKAVIFSLIGGFVLGKAGAQIFGSRTAKKVYTKVATGAYIAKDSIMEFAEKVQAGASDIAAEAKENAENYYAEKGKTASWVTESVTASAPGQRPEESAGFEASKKSVRIPALAEEE